MNLIEIDAADGRAEAYVARTDAADHPGVLLLMDAFGLRPRIAEMADRIAGWGYVVLAPNVFYRSGSTSALAPQRDLREPGAREEFFRYAMPRVRGLTPKLSSPDLAAYVTALAGMHGVRTGPIGVTGYCMGARLALSAACQHQEVAAAGCFHGGRLATTSSSSPHLGLPDARAAFLFRHADQDASMPPADIARLELTLAATGLRYSSAVYPGARHGYTMADTSAYDEAAAERHFTELEELFAENL